MSSKPRVHNFSIETVDIPRMALANVWVDNAHVLIELWAKDEQQRELLKRVASWKKEGDGLLVELDGKALLRRIWTIRPEPGFWKKDKLGATDYPWATSAGTASKSMINLVKHPFDTRFSQCLIGSITIRNASKWRAE